MTSAELVTAAMDRARAGQLDEAEALLRRLLSRRIASTSGRCLLNAGNLVMRFSFFGGRWNLTRDCSTGTPISGTL